MPAHKAVRNSIWNDQKFPVLPNDVQLVWFFLFTHPSAGHIGIYRASLSGLYDEISINGCWTRPRFDSALDRLAKEDMVLVDRQVFLIAFPKFFSEQNIQNFPKNLNQFMAGLKAFQNLPTSSLTSRMLTGFLVIGKQFGERFGKQFKEQIESCFPSSYLNGSIGTVAISSLPLLLSSLNSSSLNSSLKIKNLRPWPDDFQLSDKLIEAGKGLSINPHAEFAKARDWCKATAGVYADYDAFVRNWFRRAAAMPQKGRR